MNDYESLKKNYGEKFARFCRTNFSTILEDEGVLSKMIEMFFAPNKSLYEDLVEQGQEQNFVGFIYSIDPTYKHKSNAYVNETPEQLMKKAGYTLYKCKKHSDVLKFKKYYKHDEEICTFRDPYRINGYHIFFAVKENASEIKRENLKKPKRQDEYGTSVISIQFHKLTGNLSIKNRYNHTVINPDATFSNNLENIIPGLTSSFEKYYGINTSSENDSLELNNYESSDEGVFYKTNIDVCHKVNYCINNVILKGGRALQFDKNRYILLDYFLIDKENKTITNLLEYDINIKNDNGNEIILTENNFSLTKRKDAGSYWYDSFVEQYKQIEKIEVAKEKNGKRIIAITNNGKESFITMDKNNRMIKYQNDYIEEIRDKFLSNIEHLTCFSAKNLKRINNGFCQYVKNLENFDAPNLETIGDYFLENSDGLKICLPSVKTIGNCFMLYNGKLESINAPILESVGSNFLQENTSLKKIDLPNLKEIENRFLEDNEEILEVNLPSVKTIGSNFLLSAKNIKKLTIKNVEEIGNNFLCNCQLEEISLPRVKTIGNNFLRNNSNTKYIFLPNCEDIQDFFMKENNILESLYTPKLKFIGRYFLTENRTLKEFYFPELEDVGCYFLFNNKHIETLVAPKLKFKSINEQNSRKFKHLIKRQIKLKKKAQSVQKENNAEK